MAATAPTFVIDTLNGLVDAEVNNVFRVVADASPHLGRADAPVRDAVEQLKQMSHRHGRELADLIRQRGGVPRVESKPRGGDLGLAHLSVRFLLPKLVGEKDLILTRYENAKVRLGAEYPDVVATLDRIEGEQRQYLDVIGRVAEAVTGGRYHPPAHAGPDVDLDG